MSEPTNQVSVDDVITPEDQLSPDEIFEKICGDIRQVCEDIKKQYRTKQRSATPAVAAEKTVVMQEMSTLLENKTSIVNKLAAHVKESKYDGTKTRTLLLVDFEIEYNWFFSFLDFSHFKGEATISIPCMMEEEVDSCEKAVALLEQLKEDNAKELEV